jgi:hypothetical protein
MRALLLDLLLLDLLFYYNLLLALRSAIIWSCSALCSPVCYLLICSSAHLLICSSAHLLIDHLLLTQLGYAWVCLGMAACWVCLGMAAWVCLGMAAWVWLLGHAWACLGMLGFGDDNSLLVLKFV